MEPATSTICTLIRKTELKSSWVSSNENFKPGGNLVCKLRLSEFTIYFNCTFFVKFVQLKYDEYKNIFWNKECFFVDQLIELLSDRFLLKQPSFD